MMQFGEASSAPSVLILFAALLTAALLPGSHPQPPTTQLHAGGAINIFSRYGYLSISIRVVARNDSDPWLFREPMVDVFRDTPPVTPPPAPAKKTLQKERSLVFDGDFHMEFCDDVRQLMQAYFRDFTIERLQEPWRAYAGSWGRTTVARHLGVNSTFIGGQHCYVLVRVARRRSSGSLSIPGLGYTTPETRDGPALTESVAREIETVVPGNPATVDRFVRSFGSHYVSSYVTGNSLYQVFVYTPSIYSKIKERLRTRGVAELSRSELASFFSPWYAEHTGKIQVASGNATVAAWAEDKLKISFYFFSFASLLRLHGDARLLRRLDALLGDEAVLQLQLKSLAPAFHDPATRKWYEEVLDNRLRLWETNM
ncbi:torso-like protein [Ischnura elegans]|uniref:torso-like protein n=1 Tax=Ischnura elegans TaxID=197161 RepID=UPI001ED8890F|nr:torso-like protein [Ischnura elegans]